MCDWSEVTRCERCVSGEVTSWEGWENNEVVRLKR